MAKHKESQEGQSVGNGIAPYRLEAGRTNRVESHLGTVVIKASQGNVTFDKAHGLMDDKYVIRDKKGTPRFNTRGWRYFNRRPVPLPACQEAIDEARSFVKDGQRQIADNELPSVPRTKDEVLAEIARYMDQLETFEAADEIVSEIGGQPQRKPYKIVTDNSGKPCSVADFIMQKLCDAVRLHTQKLAQVTMRQRAEQELRAEHELAKPTSTRAARTVKVGEDSDASEDMVSE